MFSLSKAPSVLFLHNINIISCCCCKGNVGSFPSVMFWFGHSIAWTRRIKINQGHVEEKALDYYLKENYHRGKIPFHSFFPIGREDLPIISEFIMTLPDYINIDEIVVGMFNKQQLPGKPTTQWGTYGTRWF